MRRLVISWFFIAALGSCHSGSPQWRKDFSPREKEILQKSRALTARAYFATMITHTPRGLMRARVMEPFAPDSTWTVWLATNDRSRKVEEIRKDGRMTLHYFDRSSPGYVSLYGKAELVDDDSLKQKIWRPDWEKFYPGRRHYLLIRFRPERLEMIDVGGGLPGDEKTWSPYVVILRR